MTKEEINKAVQNALKTGNWMLRKSDNGRSHKGFLWNDIGKWTKALDFSKRPECGGGLHGIHYSFKGSGFLSTYKDLDFCETDGKHVVVIGNKIKCKKARVLLRNELPEIEMWNSDLNLKYCTFSKKIIFPREFKGNLDLFHCIFSEEIILPAKIGNNLYLSHNTIQKEIIFPAKVNGNLYLNGCLCSEKIILPQEITGNLILDESTFLKGIIFPSELNGNLHVFKGIFKGFADLPSKISGSMNLFRCSFPKGTTLPFGD